MEVLTKKEAAKILRISPATLDRYRYAGILPHRNYGEKIYFTREDIDLFLEKCYIGIKNG